MSLILEALRKLERDRPQEGQHGSVVLLAPRAWPETGDGRARGRWILAGAVVGGLAVLALAGLAYWWLSVPPKVAPAPALRPSTSPTPIAEATALPTPLERAPATPARPAAALARTPRPSPAARPLPAPTAPVFHLTAIGDHDGQPVAVLNDRVLRVGDSLEGARIVSIGDASVELRLADGHILTVGF